MKKFVQAGDALLRLDSSTAVDVSGGQPIVDVPVTVGVTSVNQGTHVLTGDVTFAAGTGISLTTSGDTITEANTGVLSNTVGTHVLTGAITLVAGGATTLAVTGNVVTITS